MTVLLSAKMLEMVNDSRRTLQHCSVLRLMSGMLSDWISYYVCDRSADKAAVDTHVLSSQAVNFTECDVFKHRCHKFSFFPQHHMQREVVSFLVHSNNANISSYWAIILPLGNKDFICHLTFSLQMS